MNEVNIGEIIRQKRIELGYTQEQLCEGICEPISISRIERGKQTPTKMMLEALSQRLGLPSERFYALLSDKEQQISDLQKEIVSANIFKDSKRGLEKLHELEKISGRGEKFLQQFILRSKVLLGKEENGEIKPYSFGEELEMLMEAIHITVPRFDIEEINQGLYSLDEVKIINQIALAYSSNNQHDEAIDIYRQLLKYVKKHYQNVTQSGGLLPLVAYNYSRELDLVGRYQEAINIAQLGWKSCVTYGQYLLLPGTIAIIAESLYHLGNDEESREKYLQAYYIYQGINDMHNANIIKDEAKKYLNIDLEMVTHSIRSII